MKKISQDPTKEYDERMSATLLYFRTSLLMERLLGETIDVDKIIQESWEIDRPTIVKIAEEGRNAINFEI